MIFLAPPVTRRNPQPAPPSLHLQQHKAVVLVCTPSLQVSDADKLCSLRTLGCIAESCQQACSDSTFCHCGMSILLCSAAVQCKVYCKAPGFSQLQGAQGSTQPSQATVFIVIQHAHQNFTGLNRQENFKPSPCGRSSLFSKPKALGYACTVLSSFSAEPHF